MYMVTKQIGLMLKENNILILLFSLSMPHLRGKRFQLFLFLVLVVVFLILDMILSLFWFTHFRQYLMHPVYESLKSRSLSSLSSHICYYLLFFN